MNIYRGQIYTGNLGPISDSAGSEQRGIRPALIIQNNTGNEYSPTVIVAPITGRPKRYLPTHVDLSDVPGLTPGSTAILEQIRTLDKRHLGTGLVATLEESKMRLIDDAIKVSLGLTLREGGEES
ncbi:type II toxin-antitoxin system PemK/MazF family toxin [Paenibacillus sp. HJGM_3]|uniref:type II toxin-antitoxin system PemK/MazF family toxin n=1 Tax=Paenibacillus sp. HJGM_3 TaxID=3379816 RepID=UPI003859AFAE